MNARRTAASAAHRIRALVDEVVVAERDQETARLLDLSGRPRLVVITTESEPAAGGGARVIDLFGESGMRLRRLRGLE